MVVQRPVDAVMCVRLRDVGGATRVRVRGLAGRAEFNGRTGVTISCQGGAKGRVAVRLDSGERLALKLSNLFVVW